MSRARWIIRGLAAVSLISVVAAGPGLARTGSSVEPVTMATFLAVRCVLPPTALTVATLNLDPGLGRLAFEPGRWDGPAEGSTTVPNFAFSKAEPDEDPMCAGEVSRQAQGGGQGGAQGAGDDQTRDMSQTGISATGR